MFALNTKMSIKNAVITSNSLFVFVFLLLFFVVSLFVCFFQRKQMSLYISIIYPNNISINLVRIQPLVHKMLCRQETVDANADVDGDVNGIRAKNIK